jgi:hypothetical protein
MLIPVITYNNPRGNITFYSPELYYILYFDYLKEEYRQSEEFKLSPNVVRSDPSARVFKSYERE